eukprot:gnl/MRDRNA2_/MRDRNA2_107630_c0_seq1.p1 gnl/MRDRNA2_/MRDRNA2_107630_c0~~gnl/MRDRNA2_/MRDRNA2_107630_c0_seq1.p1  ORF type:complete len:728 (+),score=126.47 gnl/MRDRNA2_/MRDRNA2_107630_c0_seq1:116-2299(+)
MRLVIATSLAWAVPFTALLFGASLGTGGYLASVLASVYETLPQKTRKSILSVPLPLRLLLLYALQLFCIVWTMVGRQSAAVDTTAIKQVSSPAQRFSAGTAEIQSGERPSLQHKPASVQTAPSVSSSEFLDYNGPFDIDSSDLSFHHRSISVVLPCAEEREYALKTVESVFKSTPSDVLLEIIVVDDGSEPPLSQTHLTQDVQQKYRMKVLRHEQTIGLIGTKQTGGDAAKGDIVVFFDCHVAPQPNWHLQFQSLISANYRRIVVPIITALDISTWTQQGSGGNAKCYLTWDADFKWYTSEGIYAAGISGGLLGMSRRWWRETGGYDKHMLGWGGENLDQALRSWLCGGEIVQASDSEVAHMWRTGDQRTRVRYKHVGDAGVNRARAVYGWYGAFTEKLKHYPNFQRGGKWYGDVSNIWAVRDRLKCRPYAWFLRRFRLIYEDAGMIPKEIFQIKDPQNQRCLTYLGGAGTSGNGFGGAALRPCNPQNDRQFWHRGNREQSSGKCCNGLRAWNTDQCLSQFYEKNGIGTSVCDIAGTRPDQYWEFNNGVLQQKLSGTCAIATSAGVEGKPCSMTRSHSGALWEKVETREPLETTLYNEEIKKNPEMFAKLDQLLIGEKKSESKPAKCVEHGCIHLFRHGSVHDCFDTSMMVVNDPLQCAAFYVDGRQLRLAKGGGCVDRWNDHDGNTWGTYQCHGGENQAFSKTDRSTYCAVAATNECFSFAPLPSD